MAGVYAFHHLAVLVEAGDVGDSLLLMAVRVNDGLELEVTDPQENQGDVEQKDGESEEGNGDGGHKSGLGIQSCGGRQENSLRTVRSNSQVLYTNTGWSVRSLG